MKHKQVWLAVLFFLYFTNVLHSQKVYSWIFACDSTKIILEEDISIGEYFNFFESVLRDYSSKFKTDLDEYVLIHFNSWIIDSLAASDYYLLKDRGISLENNRKYLILKKNDIIQIPDSGMIQKIIGNLQSIRLDINVPEYRFRIYMHDTLKYTFHTRVGQNKKKFLKLANREVKLNTDLGNGKILRIVKDPIFINPVDGVQFYQTKRDDGFVTQMPLIPWIETEINGIRNGDMIHPTTNLRTLDKAYSNGCIGLRESDAWYVYYYAPLNTPVQIRYDLQVVNEQGDTIALKDIYKLNQK